MHTACPILYFHLWHINFYHIFPHYLTNGMISLKKVLYITCVLISSTELSKKISHYKKDLKRYYLERTKVSV
jgi:hypothetical protein